ncbi:DUF3237 domain-containing protein [Flagellimonas zhangzhouensis]|uniref:UPF0311 protein SAMN04487892_1368 n=1 Tax=Flagellimonas zhangzhouensis TaxID=1073328 RepID=A0A1H2T0M3_9FLAO|nr:DUF3237 domain-containing protein [Allomuricauda zhangzhouensis]SDQ82143.1 Protein of unknown function [Allomuricauda zhangzhouensis]SDW37401.1 Protein of unknown function [Allomuricauda zhangzhouensis]
MKRFYLLFFLISTFINTQKAPELEYVCELQVVLEPAMIVGETALGTRRIIPIVGGTVEGPKIKGTILKGGSDWQTLRPDGVTDLEAHYQFKTDDGEIIYIKNTGVRATSPEVAKLLAEGKEVGSDQYYFRAIPKFEADKNGKYGWLNDAIYICTGERLPNAVSIKVWKVL